MLYSNIKFLKVIFYLLTLFFVTMTTRNCIMNNANDSFGKGFHVLKDRVLKDNVLNCLMTGRCPRSYITAVTAEVLLAFSPK